MCYNKELIKEDASLEDPVELDKRGEWTWDTFKDYCERLTKIEDDVTTQVGASMRFGYSPIWIPFVEGFGGKWYDTANKKITFTSDENVIKGIQEMVDVVESGTVVFNPTGEIHSNDVNKEGLPVYGTFDPTSQIVFQDIQFPLMASKGKTYEDSDFEWDVVSFPALPTHRVGTGASGFAVFKRNTNADAAAALCLSLYTEEGQLAYNGQEGGSVPNVKTLAEDTFWRVPFADVSSSDDGSGIYYEAFISHPEADTYGQVECVLPPDIAVIIKEGMANLIPNHINNSMSYENAIAQIQQQANELWATLSYD
jgi:ABC-type glycerol-3-phosphate transport system substrate-binding protein